MLPSRVVAAVPAWLGGSLIGAFVGAVFNLISGGFHDPPDGVLASIFVVLWLTLLMLVPVLIAALAYGVPLYALFRRLKLANTATALLAGIVPGLVWGLVTEHAFSWQNPLLVTGAATAVAYHLIYRRKQSSN